jgi:phage terminase small subunit
MRGRRPKPTALHRLEGTYHATKHGRDRAGEPIAAGDLDEPPIDLTDAQADLWRECLTDAPAGVVKRIDRKVLGVFVEAADRHNIARNSQAILNSDAGMLKLLTKGPNGTLVPSPYNTILKETADTILKCADRLGFCPTARPRIKVDDPAADAGDAWAPLRLKVLPGGRGD